MTSSTLCYFFFFFFNDTATTEIYTLSLHDALPILLDGRSGGGAGDLALGRPGDQAAARVQRLAGGDRKSTRLNSSHSQISYAVFCLKKKKNSTPRRLRDTAPGTLSIHDNPRRATAL